MRAVGIIPARYESSRFAGKVLADICGKPMIWHVWQQACKAKLLDSVIVACDDERIKKTVEGFGGQAVLTSKKHASGTERIIEAVEHIDAEVVVNIQADEPMLHSSMIDGIISVLAADKGIEAATIVKKIKNAEEITDPNVVKVVVDKNKRALYFSRSPIPFVRSDSRSTATYYKHIGLYGYKKNFLSTYKKLEASELEQLEKLEQLRILENGYQIKVIETEHETYGVDTPHDLERVRVYLESQHNAPAHN